MADSDVFTPDVVAAILRHMNDDHAGDSLLIVRAHGGPPEAVAARMTGLDATGGDFAAMLPGGAEVPVRIPWSETLTERGQVRAEVVRLYREAVSPGR